MRRLWQAEVNREVERILAMPDPAARLAAHTELSRALAEEGEAMPAEAADRILRSLQATAAPAAKEDRRTMATTWEVERRRLVLLHTLRPVAAAGCVVAAVAPFAVGAWRWGFWDAASAFLAPGRPLAGVALALVTAGVLGRLTGRADTLEGLCGLVVAAFVAGVAGLAVAVATV